MVKPTLSIIVPVYNAENYLRECINSIIDQQFSDYELILINDGSTDKSGIICEEYRLRDKRIKVAHFDNRGQSAARNSGIDMSTGEYIGFVDSDDWIDSKMYSRMIDQAVDSFADVVACNYFVMKKDGQFSAYNQNIPQNIVFSRDQAMREIYHNKILTFSLCNKIFHRKLFNNIRLTEGIIFEDQDISYKLLFRANKVVYLHDSLYYYRYNNMSTLRGKYSIKQIDQYYVYKNMYDFYKDHYPEVAGEIYFKMFKLGYRLINNLKINGHDTAHLLKSLLCFDHAILWKVLVFSKIKMGQKFDLLIYLIFPKYYLKKKIVN